MLKEFREFAMRGNVIDMAVGIVIGGAFGAIVSSLVKDMLMPPIGLLVGGIDFSNLFVSLTGSYPSLAAAEAAGAPVLRYGVFLNTALNFVIVAAALFMMVKGVNRLRRPAPTPPSAPTMKPCPECLSEIPIAAKRCAHCTSPVARPA